MRKPTWTSSSFLLYLGGFIVLASAGGSLAYLATEYGQGALVAWTVLPLAVLLAVSLVFRRRDQWIAAGIFAVATVSIWTVLWGEMFDWWGWTRSGIAGPFDGLNWAAWLIALLGAGAALVALRRFRFPLLVVFVVEAAYYVVTDLVSNGGSWSAVVTLFIGLVSLVVGVALDGGPRRPYGFWLHVTAGLTIGGALLYWWHSSETDFALLATTAVVYVFVARLTRRSSWAVLGAAGFIAAATHWTIEWTRTPFSSIFAPPRIWVPLVVFAVVGFFFVLLGLIVQRRQLAA